MPKNDYRLRDGTQVPGVTTIINQLDKPQLLRWVAKVTKEGKDWEVERDYAGDIGTLVHTLIMAYFSETDIYPIDPELYGRDLKQFELAWRCYSKFVDWNMKQNIEPVLTEHQLVSERFKFGGTPDLYANVNDKNRLIDIKTSNGIYDSYWLQLAAYGILLKENGYKVDEYQILWLPKDNRFDCPIRKTLKREKQIFKHLLGIYKLRHL